MKILRVDWKNELALIQPYLSTQGGIVCVVGSSSSAQNTFINLVRSEATDKQGSLFVQINPADSYTRLPSDILAKLEEKLELHVEDTPTFTVASDIRAGGNVHMSDVNVNCEQSPIEISRGRLRQCREIIKNMGERIGQQRIVIALFDWQDAPPATANWFWSDLWSGGLNALCSKGLVLLCSYVTDDGSYRQHDLAAHPDCLISLPSAYSGNNRHDAITDIAKLLSASTGEDLELSKARADSLLLECSDQPAQVHVSLPAHLFALQNRQ